MKKKEQMNKYCQHIQPHGKIETYYKKTKLIMYEKNYKEGKKDGIQKEWYWYNNWNKINNLLINPNIEQLLYERNYKKGKQEGIQRVWREDGTLSYEKIIQDKLVS